MSDSIKNTAACRNVLRTGVCSVLGLLLLLTLVTGCQSRTSPPVLPTTTETTDTKETAADRRAQAGFVGIDQCQSCHRERVEDFRKTRHFLACVEATQVSMPRGFETGHNEYQSQFGVRFVMEHRDGQYWMNTFQKDGQQEVQRSVRIDLVYGHGAGTDETYFSWQGHRVFELPMAWLHPQQTWGATPINPLVKDDHTRPLNSQCLSCHSTWIDRIAGIPERFDRPTALLGVTCERCHGPGLDHVQYHKANPQEKDAHSIAHPGRLSRERLIDLCAQCHDNALHFHKPPFTYRPGDVLSEFVHTSQYQHAEDNHVANQVEGMRASKCFQQSDTMTCNTCHDPHHARSPSNAGAVSCAQCHQPHNCTERERLPAAVQSQCVDCHMPAVNKVQVNFRTSEDAYVPPVKRWEHRIAVYPEARDATLWTHLKSQTDAESVEAADKLATSLSDFWRKRGEEYQKEFRNLMAIDAYRESRRYLANDDIDLAISGLIQLQTELDTEWFQASSLIQEDRPAEAIAALEAILKRNPIMSRAHGRLGTLYAAQGERERGLKHLRIAIDLDPNDSYGHGMLGWLAYLDGKHQDAIRHLTKAVSLDPMGMKLHYQLASALWNAGRLDEAETQFRAALAIMPTHLDSCLALATIALDRNQTEDAIRWGQRAYKITSGTNPEVLLLLSDCHLKAKQFDESRQAAQEALDQIPESQTQLRQRAQNRIKALGTQTKRN